MHQYILDLFKKILTRRNLLVLFLITSIASSLSFFSFQFSAYTSNEIRKIASDDVAINAQNEAYDLSRIIVNRINSITTNLQLLGNAPTILSGNNQDVTRLFDAAQYSTEDLTEYYMWLDTGGNIISASNFARASFQYNTIGQNERVLLLAEPKETGDVYYSNIFRSHSDGIDRLYISHPLINSLQSQENLKGEFKGVVVASMRLSALETLLANELWPTFNSDVILTDRTGDIIYSVERSTYGRNIMENTAFLTRPFIQELDENTSADVTEFLKSSNGQAQAGVISIERGNKAITVASQPIIQNGKHFWTLYIVAPHVFADNVDILSTQQDMLALIVPLVIGAVSVLIAYLVLSWNWKLEDTVNARTMQLRKANASLREANSQLALLNEQLEQHAKLQRKFVNLAAHELRTPIMPILGATDLIESRFQSEGGEILLKRDEFDIVSRNARRLEKLATDILDVARIETNSLPLHKEQFNLNDLLEVAVSDIKNQFPSDRVAYSILMNESIEVYADKTKLARVLSHLLSNSAKFTDQGEIVITAAKEGIADDDKNGGKQDLIHISIADTGTGIDPIVMPRLFTKFTNEAGKDRAQLGSGLGLYISKGIIEAHGGKIWAENNTVGRGATFHLTLPVYKVDLRLNPV